MEGRCTNERQTTVRRPIRYQARLHRRRYPRWTEQAGRGLQGLEWSSAGTAEALADWRLVIGMRCVRCGFQRGRRRSATATFADAFAGVRTPDRASSLVRPIAPHVW